MTACAISHVHSTRCIAGYLLGLARGAVYRAEELDRMAGDTRTPDLVKQARVLLAMVETYQASLETGESK